MSNIYVRMHAFILCYHKSVQVIRRHIQKQVILGNCTVFKIILSSVNYPGSWKSIFDICKSDLIGHIHGIDLEPPCYFSTEQLSFFENLL